MRNRKKSLMIVLLLPLLLVVLFQGLLPFFTLLASGTKENMEHNTITLDSNMVQNRKIVLENAMIDQWSTIRNESDFLSNSLASFLSKNHLTIQSFLESQEQQQHYTSLVFPELLDYLRRDSSCGAFLILANNSDLTIPEQYVGFFLRDSDPVNKTETNSDLLLERGDKFLARHSGITLDNSWSSFFNFQGQNARSADDFFYQPYQLALQNKTTDMSNLGYWSSPFILEDHPMDNHQMITYSIPLFLDGEIYGVLGTEISVSYLNNTYFSLFDLDSNQTAGYAIAIAQNDGTYQEIAGKGNLYDTIRRENKFFTLESTKYKNLFRVKDSTIGSQRIYAIPSAMTLYGHNVPYANTNWVLFGFVSENSIFGPGNQLYHDILTTIFLCAIIGIVIMFFVVRQVLRPVYRLMDSIRGGIVGLKNFSPSSILEINELHQVIKHLTENELETATQLKEEKERYRIAVESSNDLFFTYHADEQTIEIVNSPSQDGIWTMKQCWNELIVPHFSKKDQRKIISLLKSKYNSFSMQFCLLSPNQPNGYWIELNGKTVTDTHNNNCRIVGFIRDIHSQKMRELEQERKQTRDPATSLYRLKQGLSLLEDMRKQHPNGHFLLFDIFHFTNITQTYGLTFGDVLLEEFSSRLTLLSQEYFPQQTILIRAGSDEFILWAANASAKACEELLEHLQHDFSSLIRKNVFELRFHVGITQANASISTDSLLQQAGIALAEAERLDIAFLSWDDISNTTVVKKSFGEIVSQGSIHQMGLTSLVLNLFDRSTSIIAALDLISYQLQNKFALKNLIITTFHDPYLSYSIEYQWHSTLDQTMVFHCSDTDFQKLTLFAEHNILQTVEQVLPIFPWLSETSSSKNGLVIPMSDNGHYSGSIFFCGLSTDLLQEETFSNLILEIGTIIQNRINRDHHDLSAQAKSDFLARMSHEIRTPMNGIIGMTEIALKENQSERCRIDCLKKVQSSSVYLLSLLNDILDMSKIERGKMTLLEDDFSFSQLFAELHSVLDAKLKEKNQTLSENIQLQNQWFRGDALRISQVLINLLSNAIKFSPANREIILTITETPFSEQYSDIFFAVQDHGIGIEEKDQSRIFQNFEQVENISSRQQGTGLGLAISNRLIHMMGSHISLDSQKGSGSRFSFTLRLQIVAAQKQQHPFSPKDIQFPNTTVLVAEDNSLNLEILQSFLEDLGCTVDSVSNGQEAIEVFQAAPDGYYQIIFMDVMMPIMDGLKAAHAIRKLPRKDSQTIPIIAVSANAFEEDQKRSLASGMNAHLSKPIDFKALTKLLTNILP